MKSGPGITGTIYDIQGFSVQDGPGIRTTVFLKGCPLRCPWCHSPESQRFDVQLSWRKGRCVGVDECGLCIDVCPNRAISVASEREPDGGAADVPGAGRSVTVVEVDWQACDDCGVCADRCPASALSMWGKHYTVGEVVDRVIRDRPFFERSGGGVTISGGEPLSQAGFTLALLEALKAEGLHTALDTTGYAPWSVIERALPVTDLFLLDLKSVDPRAHRDVVGVPNELILENARRMADSGTLIQVRIPLIPGFNDSPRALEAMGDFISTLGEAVCLVQLLPYHALGIPKWERIRPAGPVFEVGALSETKTEELRAALETCGRQVQVH
jgi:pyruvate formate lyase activating enzyme